MSPVPRVRVCGQNLGHLEEARMELHVVYRRGQRVAGREAGEGLQGVHDLGGVVLKEWARVEELGKQMWAQLPSWWVYTS